MVVVGPSEHLYLWVVGVQGRHALVIVLLVVAFRVRLVGVFAFFKGPQYPGGVPLGKLDLLLGLGVWVSPDVG